MTRNTHVKRFLFGLLLISMLVNCDMWNSRFGRTEIIVGEYITLKVEEPVTGQTPTWVFAQLPDSSKLSGFLPGDTLNPVSFKPDVPGEYNVILRVMVDGDVEETSYFYDAIVPEDTSLVNGTIPEHLVDFLNKEDTTLLDTQGVISTTESGDQRSYLSKVVSPVQKKAKRQRSMTTRPKKRTREAPVKPSRGNLIPRAALTFTIQVSSWPSLEEAQSASQELLDNYGIESYIQRAFFKDKDEIYYRLRIGNFQEHEDAEAYAKEIQTMTSLPVWVDHVRKEM